MVVVSSRWWSLVAVVWEMVGVVVVAVKCGGWCCWRGRWLSLLGVVVVVVVVVVALTPSFIVCGRGVTSQRLCSEVVNAYLLGNVGSLAEIII